MEETSSLQQCYCGDLNAWCLSVQQAKHVLLLSWSLWVALE
jgi:hypothetical protein